MPVQNHQWHPQFLHQKERRSLCLVQDYGAQHGDCEETYPLPLIQDILTCL